MAICDVYRPEPVRDKVADLDYSNAVSSVEGMTNFARIVRARPDLELRALAMGQQVAQCLGDTSLAEYCRAKAEEDYHAGNMDDAEYARYQLARMDIAELIPLMNMPGHMGWHVAARLAEWAFHAPDAMLLGRAVERLSDSSGVDTSMVDPHLEYVLADASHVYLLTKKYQEQRLQAAMMRAKPEFRQRAAMDLCRMYLKVNYGSAA